MSGCRNAISIGAGGPSPQPLGAYQRSQQCQNRLANNPRPGGPGNLALLDPRRWDLARVVGAYCKPGLTRRNARPTWTRQWASDDGLDYGPCLVVVGAY